MSRSVCYCHRRAQIIHVRSYISRPWRLNLSTSSRSFYSIISRLCLFLSLSLSFIHERDYNIYTPQNIFITHLVNSYRDREEWRENKLYAHIHTNINNRIFTFVLCNVHFQGFARKLQCYELLLEKFHHLEYRDPKLAAPGLSVKVYTSKEVVCACLFAYANCINWLRLTGRETMYVQNKIIEHN